jgi:decaprenylphospho-beta-D-erythro-pentofuranosid-2-ulose 2-reductase
MSGRRVLILGATSGIAAETAKLLAAEGDRLFLVARSAERLRIVADDLVVRGAERVDIRAMDLNDFAVHDELLDQAAAALDGLDTVILAYAVLGDPAQYTRDWAAAEHVLRTNVLSAVSLLTRVATRFEAQGAGTIVGISSVAGDRGRQSNYVYGASKGALSLYLQGLRNRLQPKGVRVVTVKPGFVDTPMTAHLPKNALFASPARVARGIHRALSTRADVIYLPWFWRGIMAVVRAIPEPVFKRLRL